MRDGYYWVKFGDRDTWEVANLDTEMWDSSEDRYSKSRAAWTLCCGRGILHVESEFKEIGPRIDPPS